MEKEKAELALLEAQRKKVDAETAMIKKTTPFTEGIKLIGSLVVGIGGAIVAFFGFQFSKIDADRAKVDVEKAELLKMQVTQEVAGIRQSLVHLRDSLEKKNDSLKADIAKAYVLLSQVSDKISAAQSQSPSNVELNKLQITASAGAIDLLASNVAILKNNQAQRSLNTNVQELFAAKAGVRGAAYNQLIRYYANDPALIKTLLDYANTQPGNENGIYNALVLLGHLNYAKVSASDEAAVKVFAERVKGMGPKIKDRAEKVLARLGD